MSFKTIGTPFGSMGPPNWGAAATALRCILATGTFNKYETHLATSANEILTLRASFLKSQVYLLCRWERHLAGIPHLGVVDRWLATPKRARIAH